MYAFALNFREKLFKIADFSFICLIVTQTARISDYRALYFNMAVGPCQSLNCQSGYCIPRVITRRTRRSINIMQRSVSKCRPYSLARSATCWRSGKASRPGDFNQLQLIPYRTASGATGPSRLFLQSVF